jgi:hypothetical protein
MDANSKLEQLLNDAQVTDGVLLQRARRVAMVLGADEAARAMGDEIRQRPGSEPEDSVRSRVIEWVDSLWQAGVRGSGEAFSDEDRAAAAKATWRSAPTAASGEGAGRERK